MPEAGSLASLSARAWITELLGSTPEAETLISHVERLEAELERLRTYRDELAVDVARLRGIEARLREADVLTLLRELEGDR
jgi:hypothetical protein